MAQRHAWLNERSWSERQQWTCRTRKALRRKSEIVLISRAYVDALNIDKLIPPGIDVAIKFMPNDDTFLFMFANKDNLGPKVVINKMNLIVATKQMSEATELAHRALVFSGTCVCRTPVWWWSMWPSQQAARPCASTTFLQVNCQI